ncbi:MAG: hypothetical protein EA377_07670 [Phycisphaerales bacterium]|nr:MAG: hypothetical protein EA377_07670 [Phycisphaerales bacterium]
MVFQGLQSEWFRTRGDKVLLQGHGVLMRVETVFTQGESLYKPDQLLRLHEEVFLMHDQIPFMHSERFITREELFASQLQFLALLLQHLKAQGHSLRLRVQSAAARQQHLAAREQHLTAQRHHFRVRDRPRTPHSAPLKLEFEAAQPQWLRGRPLFWAHERRFPAENVDWRTHRLDCGEAKPDCRPGILRCEQAGWDHDDPRKLLATLECD